jgi:hypothetical protein
MDRCFGAPLTEAELACFPTISKAGKNIVVDFTFVLFQLFSIHLILIVHLSTQGLPHVRTR